MDIIDFNSMYNTFIKNNDDFTICEEILNKLYKKDPITYNHCYRVGCLACSFSMFLGNSDDYNKKIFNSAILHDIGKLKISNDIMNKNAKNLTHEDRIILKKHPLYGVEFILKNNYEQIYYVTPVLALHHETTSGTGCFNLDYLDLSNFIITVKICDCFDAIRVARRPDDINRTVDEALNILNTNCFHNLIPTWIEKFNKYIKYIL